MPSGSSLRTKLMHIQYEMKAPKNLFNKFGGYNYRNAESILEAFKPFGEKYKCCLVVEDTMVAIGDRYYVKATATIMDAEKPEEISVSAFAREEEVKKGMDSSQITGSTSSYARKYALNGLLALDDTKDADTEELSNESEAKSKTERKATEEQVAFLKSVYTGKNLEKLLAGQNVERVEDISLKVASSIIKKIKEKQNNG